MSILSGKAGHDLFVYGSLQDPEVVYVLLNRVPDHVSAVLSGFHRFRLKNRVYPTILPDGTGEVSGKVLKSITDDELKLLDEFEDVEYDRKAVAVVLTDTSEKLQVETYVWRNKDDPDLYGEWDFEEWKRHDKDDFITATKKFLEGRKKQRRGSIHSKHSLSRILRMGNIWFLDALSDLAVNFGSYSYIIVWPLLHLK